MRECCTNITRSMLRLAPGAALLGLILIAGMNAAGASTENTGWRLCEGYPRTSLRDQQQVLACPGNTPQVRRRLWQDQIIVTCDGNGEKRESVAARLNERIEGSCAQQDENVAAGGQAVDGQVIRLSQGGMALGRGAPAVLNQQYGVCRWVENTSAINTYFVPDGDGAGWQSFITNHPGSILVDACCRARPVTLTASDGRNATSRLIEGRARPTSERYLDVAAAEFALAQSREDCTIHCDGSRTCNTVTWDAIETVTQAFTCGGAGWDGGAVVRTVSDTPPATHAPDYVACGAARWETGEWGACSAACGGGTQARAVTCREANGALSDRCMETPPSALRACNTRACPTSSWVAGEWGACSATCGAGTQTRAVTCQSSDGALSDHCTGVQPTLLQACNMPACARTPVCHEFVGSEGELYANGSPRQCYSILYSDGEVEIDGAPCSGRPIGLPSCQG